MQSRKSPLSPEPGRRSAGFTMIEMMITIVVLVMGVGVFASSVSSLARSGQVQRETALAMDAARAKLDEVRSVPFGEAFVRFNSSAADDPATPGPAPGAAFDVPGLNVRLGDADGLVGLVQFPGNGPNLIENVADVGLGTPRDLDGDGLLDANPKDADYLILPVRIRLEWRGQTGDRVLELVAQLADL